MDILCIDLGKYSLKFVRGRIERKEFVVDDIYEELIAEHLPPATEEDDGIEELLLETQIELIQKYLDENPNIERYLINLPNEFTTTRFITIPVKSKKKAEQILPFQLEDELPFPISDAHMGNLFLPLGESLYVISSITKREVFNKLFFKFHENNLSPDAIVSEESIFQNLVQQEDLGDNIAIIDIGHAETKCYMFQNRLLIDTQTSFLAGKVVDEVIQETYKVSEEEAVLFKHQNSFFLTDEQIDSVNKEQRDFALLMKRIFQTLINDFKRWRVGYRLKTGNNITKVYICGGTSNIKNISSFLTYNFEVSVTHLDSLARTPIIDLGLKENDLNILNKGYFSSAYFTNKKALSNFKTGEYATTLEGIIPLHSISFMGLRSGIIAALLLVVLLVEGSFLSRNIDLATRKVTPILKNPSLGISNKLRNSFRRAPQRINSFIKNNHKQLDVELDTLQAVNQVNALFPLSRISQILDQTDAIVLRKFETRNESVILHLYSEKVELLEKALKNLQDQNFEKFTPDLNKNQRLLKVSYFDRGE